MDVDVKTQTTVTMPAVARSAKVAILGFGTVGQSVARILCERPPPGLALTHICNRRVQEKRADWVPRDVRWTDRFEDLLAADVDIVVELIGGMSPAESWIRQTLEAHRSVVTANKQVMAERGPELIDLARRHGVRFGFEASVAGGIPVIRGLQEGLAGDRLSRIVGILNGTCNYILTQMESGNVSFPSALTAAQELGFAEADPSADVDGLDARAKLAILSWIGLEAHLSPSTLLARTITVVDAVDFSYAHRLGCTIRQVSLAERLQEGDAVIQAWVQPALVPTSSPLASVQGSQNLVMVTGQFGGETGFFGFGAGGNPTAVAVVSDLIAIARGRTDPAVDVHGGRGASGAATSEFSAPHYLRFIVKDRPGIIAALATIFSNHGINIESVLQEPGHAPSRLPFVTTLEECGSRRLADALSEIEALDFHVEPPVSLPILGDGVRRGSACPKS